MSEKARSDGQQELLVALNQFKAAVASRAPKGPGLVPTRRTFRPEVRASGASINKSMPASETHNEPQRVSQGFGLQWLDGFRQKFTRTSVGTRLVKAASAFSNIFKRGR